MSKCLVCERDTNVIINIGFRQKSICQCCCDSITIQNVMWLIEETRNKEVKSQ